MESILKNVRMYFKLFMQPDTPWYIKGILVLAVFYLIFPADIIPDWLLGLGIIDDFAVVSILVGLAVRLLNKEIDKMDRDS